MAISCLQRRLVDAPGDRAAAVALEELLHAQREALEQLVPERSALAAEGHGATKDGLAPCIRKLEGGTLLFRDGAPLGAMPHGCRHD